ncbi:D-alanyl-D-alanine carboxypeptidase [Thermocatellispora tengchongensis]|uniref:D-alanyl-D-alanine carboxypeptidase n=1 Tax=Thermocatellispora tengchongensis TaxID=1073253 RepID=A0A840P2Z3_9ACTN|nr:serine hydrolase domain-containing protein [Thermocatellispora tengchongensis]MBB5135654.1 D-alanyl-D-alanine carboxypeptidase [Thermocatellispora tengchongensis]
MPSSFVTGLTVAFFAATSFSAPGYDQARLQRDVNAVRDIGVAGVLAEAHLDGRRFKARSGVGDLRTRRPVPMNARIRIASVTKPFVATVMLQLVGEGRLALDDTVDKWLPGLVAGNGNDGRKVSVRHLLQMTSGLPSPTDEDYAGGASERGYLRHRFRTYSPEQVVALAMRNRPLFSPGEDWNYSNINYVLAGMIIQRVTGRSWQREVTERIIVPLRLADTTTPTENPFIAGPHARGYRQFTPGGPMVDTTVLNPTVDGAASGMVSSTSDVNRFFTALVTGRLLPPAQLTEMRRTVPVSAGYRKLLPGMRYGLGLMWFPLTCGGGYWTHWGDALGYSTRGGVTPDGRRSVVVSASSNGDHLQARDHKALHPLVDHALCAR